MDCLKSNGCCALSDNEWFSYEETYGSGLGVLTRPSYTRLTGDSGARGEVLRVAGVT